MAIRKIDTEFIRESFTTEKTVSDYAKAVREIGLWESEKMMIRKYFNSEGQILDIGCGAGRTTIGLYKLGYHLVEGLDLKEIKRILKSKGYFLFTTHDRDGSKEYESFWQEEKKKWALHLEDKSLHEFGDRVIKWKREALFFIFPPEKK